MVQQVQMEVLTLLMHTAKQLKGCNKAGSGATSADGGADIIDAHSKAAQRMHETCSGSTFYMKR